MRFTSVKFKNFKALANFSIGLQKLNILVGPNNSGKSTILSAFRALEAAMQSARTRKPIHLGALGWGYHVSSDALPLSLENIHTDYGDVETTVEFSVAQAGTLTLRFAADGGCVLIARRSDGDYISGPGLFKKHFPGRIAVVPVLGPVEHKEEFLNEEYVRRHLNSHRASRHFRNYWHQHPESFDRFRALLERTWPGMSIEPPALDMAGLTMMCIEDRVPRELYWSGFGFQVWCQLLTHLERCADASLVVIDEPEIYLHPDLQRQLLEIIKDLNPSVLLATHSTEIMAEAEPADMLFVDKRRGSAKRLHGSDQAQAAFESVGSFHNVKLTQLARNRRLLFTEGSADYQLLRRFAKLAGLSVLSSGVGITNVESDGFTTWDRVASFAWGISKALDESLVVGAIFDRDYRCAEEIDAIESELRQRLKCAAFLGRKEIENYLLLPKALGRALDAVLAEKAQRTGLPAPLIRTVEAVLEDVTSALKDECMAQYIAKRADYLKKGHVDPATTAADTLRWFNAKWSNLEERMAIVPGKLVLKGLRTEIANVYGVSLTDARILGATRQLDLPADLVDLLRKVDTFRQAVPPQTAP